MMLTEWADLPMKERRIYLAARRAAPHATVGAIALDLQMSQRYVRDVLSSLVTRGYLQSETVYTVQERAA